MFRSLGSNVVIPSLYGALTKPTLRGLCLKSSTVQGIPPKLISVLSTRKSSAARKTVGEIIIKKSIRVKHVAHGPPGEKLRAIFTEDRDRRMWISVSEEGSTNEDYIQEWPSGKQKRVVRQLEISEDGEVDENGHYTCATVYKVAEKKGAKGQRFWREVRSFDWDEFASENGWFEEINRQMNKSF